MSSRTSGANLMQAMKDLSLRWQETKTYWHDAKSQEFERRWMDEIPDHVARAVSVMEELDTILRKVHADCE